MSDAIYEGTILELKQLTPFVLGLSCKCNPYLSFSAGQYVELSFPPLEGETERQFWPMAIASGSEDELVQFAIRQSNTSRVMPYLKELTEGQKIQLRGPKGKNLYASQPNRQIAMIATGTGFAPLRAILRSETYRSQSPITTVLLGADNQNEILYRDELDTNSNIRLIPVLFKPEEKWQGATGWVTDLLASEDNLFEWEQTDFYLCGQAAMADKAIEILLQRGVSKEAIFKA